MLIDPKCISEESGSATGSNNSLSDRLYQIHTLQNELTSSPSSHDVMEFALATATSLDICLADETPLVWFIVVGEPGSDKTQTVLNLKESSISKFVDTLTAQSFISGYINDQTGDQPKDLLPELDGKVLVIKDMTSLFSEREEKVKAVLGALQSIYDGAYARSIGTRGLVEYVSHFSILGCITPLALQRHQRYMSLIGSRFLINRILPLSSEAYEKGFYLIWKNTNRKALMKSLEKLVLEHIEDIVTTPFQLEPETTSQQDYINRLAQLLAKGRSVIYYGKSNSSEDSQGDFQKETGQIQTEHPWRGVYQLRNLGRALTRVHGRKAVTAHELELLRRVVLSSISFNWGQVLGQFPNHKDGMTAQQCAGGIKKGEVWTRHLLKELVQVGILQGGKGQSSIVYRPYPEFQDLLYPLIELLDHLGDLSPLGKQNIPHPPIVFS